MTVPSSGRFELGTRSSRHLAQPTLNVAHMIDVTARCIPPLASSVHGVTPWPRSSFAVCARKPRTLLSALAV